MDWSFKPIDDLKSDITPLIGETTDDAGWEKTPLGILNIGSSSESLPGGAAQALHRTRELEGRPGFLLAPY